MDFDYIDPTSVEVLLLTWAGGLPDKQDEYYFLGVYFEVGTSSFGEPERCGSLIELPAIKLKDWDSESNQVRESHPDHVRYNLEIHEKKCMMIRAVKTLPQTVHNILDNYHEQERYAREQKEAVEIYALAEKRREAIIARYQKLDPEGKDPNKLKRMLSMDSFWGR